MLRFNQINYIAKVKIITITISLKLSEAPKKKAADISSTLKDNIEKSLAEYKAGNYQTTHSVNELFKELNKN